jgi:hypothetical protein
MTKRKPSNTAEAAVKAALAAAAPDLQPPAHCRMREGDAPFWLGIVCARARDEWTEADLVVGAQLARCMHDVELQQEALDGEGSVIANDRGTKVLNPRVTVLEQLARREMALMRTLRMGGRIVGDARDAAGSRRLERQARKTKAEVEEEDLLA